MGIETVTEVPLQPQGLLKKFINRNETKAVNKRQRE